MKNDRRKFTVQLNNLGKNLYSDEVYFLVTSCRGCGIREGDTPVIQQIYGLNV